ncbi:hypothetical protein C4568_01755 [Candidatus Parcubacteria bacterium]|nr:MAG: hypothetical protein C4568_01755 [Candidatus Parcubacteria bacterium]
MGPIKWIANRRVARGVRLLDRKGPPGWRSKIDLEKLEIRSGSRCILGQIYGDFRRGKPVLGLRTLYHL